MMKVMLFILFLTLIMFNWWILVISMMILMFSLIMFYPLDFYSFISLYFNMDVLSWGLIMLTCWIMFLMLFSSNKAHINKNNSSELSLVIILMLFILVSVFLVNNMMLFYVAFEASLIPTLFLIFGWGYQPERLTSGYYLLFYTLFGSLPLLLAIFFIFSFNKSLSFSMVTLSSGYLSFYIYLSLVLAFLFKMPMLFFHYWLPKAHVEAPISGSMVLAGILLKLGGYGLIRVFKYMYPCVFLNTIFIMISLFSCFMVGLICMLQVDIKSLIAYSSVAHMGLSIAGILSMKTYGVLGSYVLMLGHGLCSSSLFCLANILYERSHSRSLYVNKGILMIMPVFSLLMFLSSVNNMSSPPTLNLLGEIYIILGLISWDTFSFLFLSLGSFLSCAYSIYMYSSVNHGSFYRGLISFVNMNYREVLLVMLHLFPLNFMVINFNMFMYLL
uniref:NADH-ubiquinone oxidoreductase chain 4 n=1 Tax=Urolabida sp. FS-2019 TaxID=2575687 RepID=A0A4D6X0N2_9HEMI|nr:NADH dehydrogenase subunit 4 [Urolabida sp. FS-2019]